MNELAFSPEAEAYLDTAVPNKARILNYLSGGAANFKADRKAAKKILKIVPSLPKWIWLHRAFVQEAAYTLYQSGFNQFLDLGSGMPSETHLHSNIPDARIVYSDTNPVAVSYGESLFAEFVNMKYIFGDYCQIQALLQNPDLRHIINQREKLAIGLNTLPLTLTQQELQHLIQELYQWAPKNSQLFQVIQTRSPNAQPDKYEKLLKRSIKFNCPMHIYPLKQTIALFKPWHPSNVHPLTQFLGLPESFISEIDQEGMGISFYAAFFTKEAD
jgi:hypothetical protein